MLAYKIKGEGVPIVLLHAFPHSSKMWEKELELFSPYARVITPDLPGFGASALIPDITIPRMAQEVARLLDGLKISEPVFLGGVSMGGYVAFEFLRQFPSRVRGLGLFATKATPDTPEGRQKRFAAVESVEKWGVEAFARTGVKSQLGKTTQENNPELVQRVLGWMKEASPQAVTGALKAMAAREDLSAFVKGAPLPALVVAGEEDGIIGGDEMRALHSSIPGSEFHVIPRSGHLVNLENPSAFHPVFKAFLGARILQASAPRF